MVNVPHIHPGINSGWPDRRPSLSRRPIDPHKLDGADRRAWERVDPRIRRGSRARGSTWSASCSTSSAGASAGATPATSCSPARSASAPRRSAGHSATWPCSGVIRIVRVRAGGGSSSPRIRTPRRTWPGSIWRTRPRSPPRPPPRSSSRSSPRPRRDPRPALTGPIPTGLVPAADHPDEPVDQSVPTADQYVPPADHFDRRIVDVKPGEEARHQLRVRTRGRAGFISPRT